MVGEIETRSASFLSSLAAALTAPGSSRPASEPVESRHPSHTPVVQDALRQLWPVAPMPLDGSGHPDSADRGYTQEYGDRLFRVVCGIVYLLDQLYDHDAMGRLLQARPDIAQRARRNLSAIVQPQNLIRPFDALHTIGRAFRPRLLVSAADRELAREILALDFDLRPEERAPGQWYKACFVGLIASLYLSWSWFQTIPLTSEYLGWLARFPLEPLGLNEQVRLSLITNRKTGDLLTEPNIDELNLFDLCKDFTKPEPLSLDDIRMLPRPPIRKGLPERPSSVNLDTFAGWLLSCLCLYRGPNDPRVAAPESAGASDREQLTCLFGSESAGVSWMHDLRTALVAEGGLAAQLMSILPNVPEDGYVPVVPDGWAPAINDVHQKYRTDKGRVKYPIESYGGDLPMTPGRLAKELAVTMPKFRNLTAQYWMFFVDDPKRLRPLEVFQQLMEPTAAPRAHLPQGARA